MRNSGVGSPNTAKRGAVRSGTSSNVAFHVRKMSWTPYNFVETGSPDDGGENMDAVSDSESQGSAFGS